MFISSDPGFPQLYADFLLVVGGLFGKHVTVFYGPITSPISATQIVAIMDGVAVQWFGPALPSAFSTDFPAAIQLTHGLMING